MFKWPLIEPLVKPAPVQCGEMDKTPRDNAELLTVVQHLDQQHHRHLAPHPGRLLALTRGDTSRLPGLDSRS